ncbi:hypothetical protein FGB62_199g09 [Gracilaria domingensis]|nr:hypothetical protein FGB62_199g09 [Gracilaria domingensis]
MGIISDQYGHAERSSRLLNIMPDHRNAGDVGNDEEYKPESEHGSHDDSEKNRSSDAREMEQLPEASDGDSSASNQCVQPASPGMVGKKVPRRVSITRVQKTSGKVVHVSAMQVMRSIVLKFSPGPVTNRSDNGADIQGYGKLPQRRAGIFSESHTSSEEFTKVEQYN